MRDKTYKSMKTLKTMMALVFALCSTFVFTSCGEDDVTTAVTDATTFSNYELQVSTNVEGETQKLLVDAFAPQLTSYSKQLTNVNQLAAKTVFNEAVKLLDSQVQDKVNELSGSVTGRCTFTISLVNLANNEVVASKTWTPTTVTAGV